MLLHPLARCCNSFSSVPVPAIHNCALGVVAEDGNDSMQAFELLKTPDEKEVRGPGVPSKRISMRG